MKIEQKPNPEMDGLMRNISMIDNTIVVMSGKGGVGKSTVSVNIARSLAKSGKKVGILDLDMHGPDVPKMLGMEGMKAEIANERIIPIEAENGLKMMSMSLLIPNSSDPVIWRGPVKIGAIRQLLGDVEWGKLDYLIVDLPPGTGDEPLTMAQFVPSQEVIIVTTPQEVAILDSLKATNFAKKMGVNVMGIIENMSGFNCPHCDVAIDLFSTGGGETMAKELDVPFLGRIPLDPGIVMASDTGKIDSELSTDSNKAISDIVDKLIANTKGGI